MARTNDKGNAVRLPVSDGSTTLVDAETAEKLAGRTLHPHTGGYVVFQDNGTRAYLHRFVTGARPGQVVDHRNGDKRDNRAANLRVVTHADNIHGYRPPRGKYPWRGVAVNADRCLAGVGSSCTYRSRRRFRSPLVAAFCRDDAAHRRRWPCEGNNFPRVIMRRDLRGFLAATEGKLFSVTFVRRGDGAVRRMLCRTGVRKEVTGAGLRFAPADRNLFSVYDVQKRQYRFIPLENVLWLTCNHERYRVLTHPFTIAA